MEYYIEYIPIEEQNLFYEKNIKVYEDLEKKLIESKMNLESQIISLNSVV